MIEEGRNCWRVARADRASLVIDAADYFRLAREAMLAARSQILLIGWDFDTRIPLDPDCAEVAPRQLGPLLSWIARHRPDVAIHILRWDWGAAKLLTRGSTVFRLARWAMTKQITFKLDGAHPAGASHHQKIMVVDDRLAFCGGIDMIATRWDTRDHRDDDDRRRRPTTRRRYQPWHDATMAVDGAAAQALGELSRERWRAAGGSPIAPPHATEDLWPATLPAHFRDVDVAIARTRAAHRDIAEVREIEALYLDMIAGARRFVYAENQFFASRVITEAVVRRLAEPDGPEFVIVNPRKVQGFIEDEAMSPARAELLEVIRKADHHRRFRIYTPVTAGGEDIYVHAKITIVDDAQLRVGSANLNNRSMGLDSECDLLIDTALAANHGAEGTIAALRRNLLAEHLGVSAQDIEAAHKACGTLIGAIDSLARRSGRTLVELDPEKPGPIEAALVEAELLDPESSGEGATVEPRPGLLNGLDDGGGRHART